MLIEINDILIYPNTGSRRKQMKYYVAPDIHKIYTETIRELNDKDF